MKLAFPLQVSQLIIGQRLLAVITYILIGGGGLIKNFFLNKKQSFSGFSLIRRSYVFVTDFDSNFQN